MMEQSQALDAFAALAQETRLSVLKLLIKAGAEGMTAGAIAQRAGVVASTLSFHVAALERAGLVRSWRVQRQIFYAPNMGEIRALLLFLMQDCCGGHPEICSDIFGAQAQACADPAACAPVSAKRASGSRSKTAKRTRAAARA